MPPSSFPEDESTDYYDAIDSKYRDFANLSETQKLILHNSTKSPPKPLRSLSEAARFFIDYHQNGTPIPQQDPDSAPMKIVGSFIVPNNYGKVFAGGVIREDRESKDPSVLADDGDESPTHDKERITKSKQKKLVRAWIMRRDTPQKLRETITDIYYVFFNSLPTKEEREMIKAIHGKQTIIVMVDNAGNEVFKRIEGFDAEEEHDNNGSGKFEAMQFLDPGDDREEELATTSKQETYGFAPG